MRSPRFLNFTSAPARFPRLRLRQIPRRTVAPPTRISIKLAEFVKTGEKNPVEVCRMIKSSSLEKVAGEIPPKT